MGLLTLSSSWGPIQFAMDSYPVLKVDDSEVYASSLTALKRRTNGLGGK